MKNHFFITILSFSLAGLTTDSFADTTQNIGLSQPAHLICQVDSNGNSQITTSIGAPNMTDQTVTISIQCINPDNSSKPSANKMW